MTATGMGPANSAMSSAEPVRANASIRSCANAAIWGRKFFDATRDEGAIDEIAQPRVLGRLELQDRVALERIEGLKMRRGLRPGELRATYHVQDLPAKAAIAQQGRKRRRGGRSTRSHTPPRRKRAPFRGSLRRRDRDR